MILTDIGAQQLLNSYFKKIEPTGGDSLTVKLFVNDITPSDADTASAYTEASGGGYAPATLSPSGFTVSIADGIATCSASAIQFVFTGELTTNTTIYGAYIVDDDGVLIASERAPASFTPSVNGDSYTVVPTFRLSKGTVN